MTPRLRPPAFAEAKPLRLRAGRSGYGGLLRMRAEQSHARATRSPSCAKSRTAAGCWRATPICWPCRR